MLSEKTKALMLRNWVMFGLLAIVTFVGAGVALALSYAAHVPYLEKLGKMLW